MEAKNEFEKSPELQKKVMEAMDRMKPEAEHGSHLGVAFFVFERQTR